MPLFHRCITGCINEFFTLFCGIMYPAEPSCLFPQNIAKSSPFRRPEQEPHSRGQKGAKFFVHFPQNTIWLRNLGPLSEGGWLLQSKSLGECHKGKEHSLRQPVRLTPPSRREARNPCKTVRHRLTPPARREARDPCITVRHRLTPPPKRGGKKSVHNSQTSADTPLKEGGKGWVRSRQAKWIFV